MLKGRKVVGENGGVSQDLLKNQTGIQVQAYDSEDECLLALLHGDVDALWAEAPPHGSR